MTNPECRNFETITNANKLVGVTTGELKNAIATIPKVTALCTRTTALTIQANSLLTGLGGISLGGLLPVGLELKIPSSSCIAVRLSS